MGRTQQALDLANQLFKQEPDEPNRELLKKATLARAKQLRGEGKPRDAATVLQAKLNIGGSDATWRAAIAEELAACGAIDAAVQAIGHIDDASARSRIFPRAADAALELGPVARYQLPEDLRPGFDLVPRTSTPRRGQGTMPRGVQGSGCSRRSWNGAVKLRLMAFQAKDDAQRWKLAALNAERLPCRLAAPRALGIDNAFVAGAAGRHAAGAAEVGRPTAWQPRNCPSRAMQAG